MSSMAGVKGGSGMFSRLLLFWSRMAAYIFNSSRYLMIASPIANVMDTDVFRTGMYLHFRRKYDFLHSNMTDKEKEDLFSPVFHLYLGDQLRCVLSLLLVLLFIEGKR